MEKTVLFREFEERDIDFIYRCKNDEKLNKLIVGQYRPFSFAEATKWVHGCMGEHETFHFWAICTNDQEKRIIGWVSLSDIDKINKSACFHGIVIGDSAYRDGIAWIETYLFIYEHVFETLSLNRLTGSCLTNHKQTLAMREVMFVKTEGLLRQALYKDGSFVDVSIEALLREDYLIHKQNGDYDIKKVIKRLVKINKEEKNK